MKTYRGMTDQDLKDRYKQNYLGDGVIQYQSPSGETKKISFEKYIDSGLLILDSGKEW